MENKLPDDQLEHFLRNSFKDYSEKPSEEVWDKIDYSLDHQLKKVPSNKKWIWMMSAAAVVGVILYLGANNIYLKNKLRKEIEFNKSIAQGQPGNSADKAGITKILPEQKVAENDKEELKKELNPNGSGLTKVDSFGSVTNGKLNSSKKITPLEKSLTESLSSDNKTKNQIEYPNHSQTDLKRIPFTEKQNQIKNNKSIELSANQNIKPINDRINGNTKTQGKNIKSDEAERALRSATEVAKLNEINSSKIPDINLNERNNTNSEKDNSAEIISTVKEAGHNDRLSIDLTNLPSKETSLTSLSGIRAISPGVFTDIIPVKIPTAIHWSELSVHGGIIQESGSLTDLRRLNTPFPSPTENTFTTANSWTAGLGFSKSLNKNLFVSTGLAFKNYELINTINQSLIFGGRINPGSGSTPFHHDWDFKLNCPGGTSNIMIQSEQLDSRATISDNEQVKVNIKNTEKLNYLTIPVSVNYRSTLGKISLMAGGGLQMNILTRSSFEDPTIQIKHPQLKTRMEPQNSYRFDKSNPVVWNGTLSAGIAYAVAPKISLQLMPSWYLPITNRNLDHDVKVNSTSFAIQLGLNYSLASL